MIKDFILCPNCNEWHWTHQKCDPVFFVSHEEYLGDEEKKIHAYDHSDAAKKYAKYYNENGDYPMMGGSEITVKVRGFDDDGVEVIKTYSIQAQPSIEYYCNEL